MHSVDLDRELEIRSLGILDQPAPPALQHIVDAAAETFGFGQAAIHLVTATQQHTVVSSKHVTFTLPVEYSLCHTVLGTDRDPYVVPDARVDSVFRGHPMVTGKLASVVFYAGTRLRTQHGHVVGTLCIADFAEHEPAEEQLRILRHLGHAASEILIEQSQANELGSFFSRVREDRRLLVASNAGLADFAAEVAHDLQGPLSSLLATNELIGEHLDLGYPNMDPELTYLLDRNRQAIERMDQMVREILDFSMVAQQLQPTTVNLNEVVAEVLSDLPLSSAANITVEDLPDLLGVRAPLRSVMANLIGNALKYGADTQRPVITITVDRLGSTARIHVRDRGPGIRDTDVERLFRRGERGEGAVATGYGIGLATCARMIHQMNGAIAVDKNPDGGADFWFELPVP